MACGCVVRGFPILNVKLNMLVSFQVPARVNREPGEDPGRTRHCNGERTAETTL